MKITATEYTNKTDILIAPELAFAIPCVVSNAGVIADSEGRKIIKAGTPLYAAKDVFMNREEPLHTTDAGSETIYGVARWDIDVTEGETENATLLVSGYVDYLKLESDVQSKIDTAKTNISRILFIKGRKS